MLTHSTLAASNLRVMHSTPVGRAQHSRRDAFIRALIRLKRVNIAPRARVGALLIKSCGQSPVERAQRKNRVIFCQPAKPAILPIEHITHKKKHLEASPQGAFVCGNRKSAQVYW